jgi:c-di-GMP-binding flagellar brake protein YcgR
MSEEELFSKIDNDVQREKIFESIIKLNAEIHIQLKDNTMISIKSLKKHGDELIIFRDLPGQPIEQEVIVTFNISPEKYFLKTNLIQKNKTCHIKLSPYLYKLQRRKNFRLTLPKLWDPKFECLSQGVDKVGRTFTIYDLSSGGFSFEFIPGEFLPIIGANLEGTVKVKNRLELAVTASIKHSREVGTKAYPRFRIGLEIVGMTSQNEAQIMAVLMEVHREIFSKLK